MELKLAIEPDTLKALYLAVGKTKTELKQRGYGGGNGTYTYTYESEAGFPAKSRLVAISISVLERRVDVAESDAEKKELLFARARLDPSRNSTSGTPRTTIIAW